MHTGLVYKQPAKAHLEALNGVQLLAKRPDRWGGEDSAKKLYFARRAAMVVHWAKRHSFATKQKENTSMKKKQEKAHVQASSVRFAQLQASSLITTFNIIH